MDAPKIAFHELYYLTKKETSGQLAQISTTGESSQTSCLRYMCNSGCAYAQCANGAAVRKGEAMRNAALGLSGGLH